LVSSDDVSRAGSDEGVCTNRPAETVIDAPTADLELSSREEMKEVNVDDRRYRVRSVTKTVLDTRSSEQLGRWTHVQINIEGAAGIICSPTGPNSILQEAEMFDRIIGQRPR
jgi:hypothetical protein